MGKRAAALIVVVLMLGGCDVVRELQGAQWSEAEPEPEAAPEPETGEPAVDSARARITFRPLSQEGTAPWRRLGVLDAELVYGGDVISYTFDVPKRVRRGIEGPEVAVIVEGDAVYVRPYADEESLPEDKYWWSMSVEDLQEYLPDLARPVQLLVGGELLAEFRPPPEQARGKETVRGAATTRYVYRRSVEEVAAEAGIPRRRWDELRAHPAGTRVATWVDRKGLVRRIEFPMLGSPRGPLLLCTIETYDIDAPLTIQMPVPQDVAPF